MDLPIVLNENSTFVTGVWEMRQNLYLIIKEPVMTWYQSIRTGSFVSLHTSDTVSLRNAVRDSVAQIRGIEIESVEVIGNNVELKINYNGRELTEKFELENNE